MSNTVVTKYGEVTNGKPSAGNRVLVFVNQNGTISLERDLVQKIVDENDYENSTVSVVRFEEPDRMDDPGADQIPRLDLTVDAFYDPETVEPYEEVMTPLRGDGRACLVAFKNDHCYTPYDASDGRERDVLPRPPISNAKKITVLEDTVIPRGKKIIQLNANDGKMILKRDALEKAKIVSPARHPVQSRPPTRPDGERPEPLSFQGVFVRQNAAAIDGSAAARSVERPPNGRPESRKIGTPGAPLSRSEREAERRRAKRAALAESRALESLEPKVLLNAKISESERSKSDPLRNRSHSKRDRKPSDALLNDVAALFSAPDVIRRVSADVVPDPKGEKPPAPNPGEIAERVHPDAKRAIGVEAKTYSNAHSKSNRKNPPRPPITEALSVLTVLDEAGLTNFLQDDPNAAMLAEDVAGQLSDKHAHHGNPNSMILSPNTLHSAHIAAPLSPGLDLLGGLQPEEAGLTEDLMMHVAQLVESSENLQEVIDKEVLGKVNDLPLKDFNAVPANIIGIPPQPRPEAVEPVEKPPTAAVLPSKEPITIVRGNGRVITLPPIEAPATRSKRKSMLNATVEAVSGDASLNKMTTPATQSAAIKEASKGNAKRSQRAGDHPSILTKLDSEHVGDSDGSWNSEDDPDRLWCICKQPHNNRFMICCDMCEDWFHGKCVNVTKAMGQEMEAKGIEWRCPNCVQKTKQQKALQRRSSETKVDDNKAPQKSTGTNCIVCKKPARANSIYCSDVCILKHAQDSLPPMAPKTAPGKDSPQNKPKVEQRVVVIDRVSGKYLAGPSAPTAANLKTWLQEHPTYEVVKPVNKSPQQLNVTKTKPKPDSPKPVQSIIKLSNDNQAAIGSPMNKNSPKPVKPPGSQQSPALKVQSPKPNLVKPGLKSPTSIKSPTAIKSPQPIPSTSKIQPVPKSPTTHNKPTLKSPPSQPSTSKKEGSKRPTFGEPIRESVRKALQDHLTIRMAETKEGPKLTPEEIKKFSVDTEHELHEFHNKDVGAKYKSKYRSLMFNLKDRKNLTLWQKICDKTLTPKQLVRLSPEELASQELAQWRDKEAKHQLELIKKSELDLLSCAKTYVLKTHKGEEVIQSKSVDMTELDPNVSVEDLVTVLNKSGAEDLPEGDSKSVSSSNSNKHSSKHDSVSKSRHDKSDKKSHSKDSKSSRSHHRKSSRERDRRDHRKHDDRKSSTSSSGGRHRSKSKSSSSHKRDKSRTRSRSKDRSRRRSDSRDKDHKSHKDSSNEEVEINIDEKMADNNILVATINEALKESNEILKEVESKQELENALNPLTAPLWKGCMSMVDVAKFNYAAHKICGDCTNLSTCLNPEIDVVGRISPEIVWDYLTKMKKQGNKDIQIIKLVPAATDDSRLQFDIFYSYLESRNRLGVARAGSGLKDFYVWPMTANTVIPEILSSGFGLTVENPRVDILVGIIVKQRKRRSSMHTSAIPPKIQKTVDTYTPPGSPKRIASSVAMPAFIPGLMADENEPYSPRDSDEDLSAQGVDDMPISTYANNLINEDLQRKMDELNRKIEEEKKAIESMSSALPGANPIIDEEPYSPSRPMTPPISHETIPALASISLPSNLQEILASIQKQGKPDADAAQPEPYMPTPISHSVKSDFYGETSTGDVDMRIMHPANFIMPAVPPPPPYAQSVKPAGTLSSLSEEQLLSMVPDGELLPPTYPSARLPDVHYPPPPYKKPKLDYTHLAPPGTED